FENVMEQLDIQINLGAQGGESFTVTIKELDDFHPDHLFESLAVFQRLRQLRRQLNNPASFQAAANEIQGWLVETEAAIPETMNTDTQISNTRSSGGLLDSILDSAPKVSSSQQSGLLVDQLIAEVVRPYIVEAEDPNKEAYIQAVDNALTDQMRAILHHPNFQEIESAWRDLYFLVRRLETGSQLKLFLLDSDKNAAQEMLANVTSHQPDIQLSLVVGHYAFSPRVEEIDMLTTLGSISQQCNAPFFAAADSGFVGLEHFADDLGPEEWPAELSTDIEQHWNELRRSSAASYIALTLPRFIGRYPYGKKSGPVDSFSFEEFSQLPVHEHYLWSNGATLLAYMIANAFSKDGWQLNPNEQNRVGGLPTHHYEDDDGERVMKPCAEINLTSRGSEMMTNRGLIPIFSVRNEDSVQVGKIASIAVERKLKGRWVNP
ncbi:type VI secretion system contractile sheath domain-containing protein, partial [Pseudomonadota bacterium]